MQPIAPESAYADTREIYAQVIYELVDTRLNPEITVTATNEDDISNKDQTINKMQTMSKKIATLEPDFWTLDGTFLLYDDDSPGEVGYWSDEISDANGEFVISPVLTYDLSEIQDSKGFTIVFDDKSGEYASDFLIQVYNASNGLIGSVAITENTQIIRYIEFPTTGYKKVTITFTRTHNPYRRIKVAEFVFGSLHIFDGKKIKEIKVDYEVDLMMRSLPTNVLTVIIDNSDKSYNVNNPSGIYYYLQKGQGLLCLMTINGETINMGRPYFEKAESDDDALTVAITAYDYLYSLDDTECNIGENDIWKLKDAITAVIADSGYNIKTVMPDDIGNRIVLKTIPQKTSHREAIRILTQAAMCICYIDRYDNLVFTDINTGLLVDELNGSRMIKRPKVLDTGLVNTIKLTVKNEYLDNEYIEITTDRKDDENERSINISNPVVGAADVPEWLLSMAKYRMEYEVDEQGNPARDLLDCVKIYDVYGENKDTLVIRESFTYNGGLSGSIKTASSF